jgi:hypothetical protein
MAPAGVAAIIAALPRLALKAIGYLWTMPVLVLSLRQPGACFLLVSIPGLRPGHLGLSRPHPGNPGKPPSHSGIPANLARRPWAGNGTTAWALGRPVADTHLGRYGGILTALLPDRPKFIRDGYEQEKSERPGDPQSEFKGEMGVARADITPPTGIYSRSWGSALHDAAEGIHRPLFVTSLFMRGGELELYLVCFDLGWWYDNGP